MHLSRVFLGSTVIVAFLVLATALPLYAAGYLSGDFGKLVEFKPLVRHMMSQVHCYDAGTDECETTDHLGTYFQKEHTLGFLLNGSRSKMKSLGFQPVYVCTARDNRGVMMVTAGTTENDPKGACRDAGFRASHIGYISSTNQIEAPSAVYRCVHPDTNDTLLTLSANECTAASYGSAELLGYLYAGGPLQ